MDQPSTKTVEPEVTSCQPVNKPQNEKSLKQYAVKRIIHDVTTMTGPHCLLHWCGYSSKEEAFEPLEYLQKHFMNAYKRLKER